MKKLISIAAMALIVCMLFSACAKEPDPVFVAMDMDSKITVVRASNGSIAFEGGAAYDIAEAYNATASIEAFDEEKDEDAEWVVIIMCTKEDPATNPTIYRLSYLGNNEFNVKIQGSDKQQYKIVSELLYKTFAAAIEAEQKAEH